jgi:hypothetical protein
MFSIAYGPISGRDISVVVNFVTVAISRFNQISVLRLEAKIGGSPASRNMNITPSR